MLVARVRWCRGNSGQASLLMLGVTTLLLGLAVVLFALGSAVGPKVKHQRAAVSAGQVMRDLYPRLFEPPVLANGVAEPAAFAVAAVSGVGAAGGGAGGAPLWVEVSGADMSFPGGGLRRRGWRCACAGSRACA
jgi:hypothetical protein